MTDLEAVLREANQAAARLLGLPEQHLQGKPLPPFVSEESRETFDANLRAARAGDPSSLAPFHVRLQPGNGEPIHASITITRGERMEEDLLLWLIRDITPRVEAQHAVEQRELRLQILNSIATDLIERQPLDEIVQHAVDQLAEALPGVRAAYCTINEGAELHVQHVADTSEKPSRENLQFELTAAPEYHQTLQWGQYVVSADVTQDERLAPLADFHAAGGSQAILDVPIKQWNELTGVLCCDASRPHAWSDFEINLLNDVANQIATAFRQAHIERERRRIEKALVKSETLLREAQRLGRIGSWIYDIEADEITWSEMTYEIYKRPHRQGPPANFEDNLQSLYPPQDAARLRRAVERAIEEGEPYEIDLRVELPSEKRPIITSLVHP